MPEAPRSLQVFADLEMLSQAAAAIVAEVAAATIAERGRCTLALAGGSTPQRLYDLLASPYAEQIPWAEVVVFWGDERFVPPDHPASNHRMAAEHLLRHVPLPSRQIYPIPTTTPSPHEAAARYDATLRSFFADAHTTFDLVLLGLGADGHTASLFPGHPLDSPRWVEAVTAPPDYAVRQRITLTLTALNRAQRALFLVAGPDKQPALHNVFHPSTSTPTLPAAHVHARQETLWFVDQAAGTGI